MNENPNLKITTVPLTSTDYIEYSRAFRMFSGEKCMLGNVDGSVKEPGVRYPMLSRGIHVNYHEL